MTKALLLIMGIGFLVMFSAMAKEQYESDIIKTSAGDLKITFLGHGTLMFDFNNLIIHVDPYSQVADYAALPRADLILITHEHPDHLDLKALAPIRQDKTTIVLTQACAIRLKGGLVMKNGDQQTLLGLTIHAVPAYNIQHKRPDGQAFHPKGIGNGYVITFGDKRIYIAGDTENIPEMKALEGIDCAFLPMNLPYTMTPAMVAEAAKVLRPQILYPYHFGETDTADLVALMKNHKDSELRIRNMR